MRKPAIAVLCALSIFLLDSLGQPSGVISPPSDDGSPYSRIPDGSGALVSPFLTPQYHGTETPYNGASLNPFTGQPGLSVPLASIQVHGRAGYSVALNYTGKTRDAARDDNKTSPASWVGLGWSLQTPFIARNHKATSAGRDDILYANLGPLGEGMLVRGASGTYYMAGNPYLIVSPAIATGGAFSGQIESWTVKTLDGSLYVFGDLNGTESPSERIVYQENGPVRVSQYSIGNAAVTPFIYRWDLRYISDAENKNRILFDYQKTSVNLFASGKSYTQQSFPKTIRYLDRGATEAERIEFFLADKGTDEYVAPNAELPPASLEPMETKYLTAMRAYHGGTESNNYTFTYTFIGTGKYRKRLLDEIRPASRLSPLSPTFINAPIWKFTYDAAQASLIKTIQKPTGGKTEFEYGLAALGTSGQQPVYNDANNRLKNDAGAIVSFPNNSAWENLSSCSERYCILAAKDGNKVGGKLYLEFTNNRGNYVDPGIFRRTYTAPSATVVSNWKWAASGDYLVAYDANAALVYVHEWDGVNWSFKFQADFGPVSGSANPLSVHLAPDYFVVTQAGNPLNKAWVYLKRDNTWTRLNAGSTCDLDNNGTYGETVKNAGFGCLEFNSTLKVAISSNWFALVHDATDIVFAYALAKDGNSFVNVSGAFLNFGDGVQHATYANNWSQNISALTGGPDYVLIHSVNATQQRLDAIHFDGINFRRVATSGWENGVAADLTAAAAESYFVTINQSTGLVHLWRRAVVAGGFTFMRSQARSGVPARSLARVTLRAFPEAFTFEYGRLTEDFGKQPIPILEGASDLSSWLYQVDPTATNGVRDRSPDIRFTVAGGTTKLFGITITPDNFLAGVTMRSTAAQASVCPDGGACTPFFATLKIKRGETGTPYAHTARAVDGLSGPSLSKHVAFSVARTAMLSWFDGTAQVVKFRLFAFDGDDFAGAPENVYVVKKITERSGVDVTGTGAGPDVIQTLTYDEGNGEFNTHLQLPQFPKCTQRRVAADGTDQGRTEIFYNLDSPSSKWYGRTLRLNGTVKETQAFNQAGNLIALSRSAFRPFGSLSAPADWPATIPLVRLASDFTQDVRPNGSKMGSANTYSNFNNLNGQPHFVKTFQDDTWKVNQNMFDGAGRFIQAITFSLPYASYPGAGPDLEAVNPAVPFTTVNAVGSNKTEYDPANPYYPLKRYAWRDIDQNLTDAQLQAGAEPAYNLSENWVLASEVRRRNIDLQVEETRLEKSAVAGGESFTSVFYEGRKQLMAGMVSNAELPNCALLLGENGDVPGLATLDLPGRWAKSGTSYSTNLLHTGRYGIKVTDAYGPTINLNLQNVRRDGFGYVVSVWIYRPTGSTGGGLTVERRNAANAVVSVHTGTYVPQDQYDFSSSSNNRWERWEVKLTNSELIAGGLFNGAADYLRVWAGTGNPTGNAANVLYVDDFACTPTNSRYTLSTFDYRGFPTSTTNTRHKPTFMETDYSGSVVGTRDERGRMFRQGSANLIGEN